MSTSSRIRRIGWFAALAVCTALYLLLHLRVMAVHGEVVRAERSIVRLEQEKILLETEFETRASLLQLAAWNRVDFGYSAPTAAQFLDHHRDLAEFGSPRAPGAPEPIRVARADGDAPAYPKLVSPLTGRPIDPALLEPESARRENLAAAGARGGAMRVPLGAVIGNAAP
ncbi:MAG: hypothetical protein B7Z08_09595 [Sphingomonadales bacterium 32-68-7]|nr:MAG: hypothetical protein B7Z33_06655 [Sphingomonadales bacterium 12-68-11]OYX08416.1 MAG: hypothetical protein B7Z08_09595 [Sphingomonadales bacterium 32-68-7]